MKTPLPHFLPSARLAHLRLVNKVREIVQASSDKDINDIGKIARHRLVRRKYVSWNASSAAQTEIIEYLEELTDLTKLLVGANEFHSGLLKQPTYRDYVDAVEAQEDPTAGRDPETRDTIQDLPNTAVLTRRRTNSTVQSADIQPSLRRIQSRNRTASTERRNSSER